MKWLPEHIDFLRRFSDHPATYVRDRFNERFGTTISTSGIRNAIRRYGISTRRPGRPAAPAGTERRHRGHIYVKIQGERRWRLKSRVMWERHHGRPAPAGHVVRHLDCNKENYDRDNLILVSYGVNMVLNRLGFDDLPLELRPTMIHIASLYVAIAERRDDAA